MGLVWVLEWRGGSGGGSRAKLGVMWSLRHVA